MWFTRPRGIPIAHNAVAACGALLLAAIGCGSKESSGFPPGDGINGSSASTAGGGGTGSTGGGPGGVGNSGKGLGFIGMTSGTAGGAVDAGSDAVAPGDLPDPNCPAGVHTSVSGLVYDPSFQDPLYNITVFAPKSATLPVLPKGAQCLSCDALYPPFYGSAVTDATGHFVVNNVPPGTNVPLVVQTGKWRKEFMLPSVKKCVDNPQPDKSLRLPKNGTADGNLPDIAISTGKSDSLECLLLRIGVDAAEYTGGAGTAGHIHIFFGNGSNTATQSAPASYMSLWDKTADLLPYDVTLLSCEGGETQDGKQALQPADQQNLLDYANAGGRVFASHFHYAWFNTGPWTALNLATWYAGQNALMDGMSFPEDVFTTLLAGGVFPEGVALKQWLGVVNALDMNGFLQIYYARHNSDVLPPAGPAATPSQPWIIMDPSVTITVPGNTPTANAAQYFTVDTPVTMAQKCGRVVYSDLHVSGGGGAMETGLPYFMPDYPELNSSMTGGIVPDHCAMHPLTPQEKALEFMIFDLSSCLIPIGQVAKPPRGPA
jgi:hypothetical protein